VVEDLPEAVTRQLKFSHVIVLSGVSDPATRHVLAQAAADNAWTGEDLKNAIAAALAGRWIDAELDKPGLQPPEPEPEVPVKVAAGRVVTRFEKALEDFGDLASLWDGVAIERLPARQLQRVDASLTALEGHIATVRARLAAART
jgi:hypothetical protein